MSWCRGLRSGPVTASRGRAEVPAAKDSGSCEHPVQFGQGCLGEGVDLCGLAGAGGEDLPVGSGAVEAFGQLRQCGGADRGAAVEAAHVSSTRAGDQVQGGEQAQGIDGGAGCRGVPGARPQGLAHVRRGPCR